MRHLAAYLLLVTGGNPSPSAEDVTKLLSTVGVETDKERLSTLLAELAGKDISELIAIGRSKLQITNAPAGGAAAAPAAAAGKAPPAAAEEKPKEAEKPKVEEVDPLAGGMDMFGGGGGGGGDY